MPERPFFSLADDDRRYALAATATASGRRTHLLEKDVWVVQTLEALMATPFGGRLTLKGGTSLAKAYRVTRRFSEDLDVTYDIRAIAPDLVADGEEGALPTTRSQERRWTREIRARLDAWVQEELMPAVVSHFARTSITARLYADRDRLYVGYSPLFGDYGFVKPEVAVEFGARSTGEPREERHVECDAAPIPLNAPKLETFVVEKIRERILTEETIVELVQLVAEEIDAIAGELSGRLEVVEAELSDVQRRLGKLYEAIETSELTLELLSPRIMSLRHREEQLEAAREDAETQLERRRVELPTTEQLC